MTIGLLVITGRCVTADDGNQPSDQPLIRKKRFLWSALKSVGRFVFGAPIDKEVLAEDLDKLDKKDQRKVIDALKTVQAIEG